MGEQAYEGIVDLKQIGKRYSKKLVLADVSLALRGGEVTAIVGSNGSGKSTLLRIAAGLTAPSSGTRKVSGNPVIGYAPDRLPKLRFTPREYLGHMAALERSGDPKESPKNAERIEHYLELYGLADTGKALLRDFSKGMLQKVNLIQALMRDPRLLILDEPFGGLDEAAERRLEEQLNTLKQGNGAVVLASHEGDWVARLADRVVTVGAGRIVSDRKAVRETRAPVKIVEYRQNGRLVRYEVKATESDALLRRLLEEGASILSVQEKVGRS